MLIKEIDIKCEKKANDNYIWTFKDKNNESQILLLSKFKKRRGANNRIIYGSIVSNKLYRLKSFIGNTRELIELDVISPIKSDITNYISSVGIVLYNSKLKLVIQYNPLPNIAKQVSYDVHPVLLQQLGIKLTCRD